MARAQLLALGFKPDAIEGRLDLHRLIHVHRTVYAVGHGHLTRRSRMTAAVLACGDGALLSHRSAAELWGIGGHAASAVDVNAPRGRQGLPRRTGIRLHRSKIDAEDRANQAGIPATTVARTLFDLAEVVERMRLERAWEEADRLGLLQIGAVERVCERGRGRHALRPIRRLLEDSRY
ncbi:MAG TPA: type IV toxin-antitoxin system AbiEi family antitoxin, partial [Solirubrobacterales bacterium]|nr:type IV toxin-antitoxin system AbiEi family antitoxin [Solirubrobacterales bacterium]